MQSLNFEFLRKKNEVLAELGTFAETYVHSDPAGALVKLRLFGENLLSDFLCAKRMARLPQATFSELLDMVRDQHCFPAVILDKLHYLRRVGNQAAHDSPQWSFAQKAMTALQTAFDLGKWFNLSVYADPSANQLVFREPVVSDSKGKLQKEKKEALQRIALQEIQMSELLERLEATRAQAEAAEKSEREIREILAQTNQAAEVLQFDEAATRSMLIDLLLAQAGWDISPESKNLYREYPVDGQPTSSGKGFADYVLLDEQTDLPVAVIEAKKTSIDPVSGKKKAILYADALEKQFKKRPVIFYTNGHDIYLYDDAKGEIERRIYGFYGIESLRQSLWRTENRVGNIREQSVDENVIDRNYQIEAVKSVCEKFVSGRRKALIVQATGTGKTRVAIALSKLLIEHKWVRRILFLCDRRELRRQAYNAFGDYLDAEPRVYVTNQTSQDRNKTVYIATYPAMKRYFRSFDVGFFDLVIADESHRSIYNRYRDLFLYFDALQVGLTATPRDAISHNTFGLFDCESGDPTFCFSYEEAIRHVPPYLAHFVAMTHTTNFMRKGIRYSEMTPQQRQQIEEQVGEPESVDFAPEEMDRAVFNKDTDRKIIRNFMENGIRDADGQKIGKTIVFARDHRHAVQMARLFDEMYPQYTKPQQPFCAVIDNYIERAEDLIDDFKGLGPNKNLTLVFSVDMLDTGVDVPEVVNLVFAKPVKSRVKFWQMIGRGTRLCKNLFGPGKDKDKFLIFDHWGNFDYFGEHPDEAVPSTEKSLLQRIFEARLDLADLALEQQNTAVFDLAVSLIQADVRSLPEDSIAVQEKWMQVKSVRREGVMKRYDAGVRSLLRMEIARLMQWRGIIGGEESYRFDLLMAKAERSLLKKDSHFDNLKSEIIAQVSELPINIAQVKAQHESIEKAKSDVFWQSAGVPEMEELRSHLRGIMRYQNRLTAAGLPPLVIDVTDTDEISAEIDPKFISMNTDHYRSRVEGVLNRLWKETPALEKIRLGRPVTEEEIAELSEKVILRDPQLTTEDLLNRFSGRVRRLDLAIRRIIGLDAEAVNRHFSSFIRQNPSLNTHQIRFLEMVKQYIARNGCLEMEKLYDPPFTTIHHDGIDGVFPRKEQTETLLDLIEQVNDKSFLE